MRSPRSLKSAPKVFSVRTKAFQASARRFGLSEPNMRTTFPRFSAMGVRSVTSCLRPRLLILILATFDKWIVLTSAAAAVGEKAFCVQVFFLRSPISDCLHRCWQRSRQDASLPRGYLAVVRG